MKKLPRIFSLIVATFLFANLELYAKNNSQTNTIKKVSEQKKTSRVSRGDMPEGLPIVVEVENVTVPPKLIRKAEAVYPSKARKKGLEGKVIVRALIDTLGNVEKVTVIKSTNKIFNEPAIKAVKQYKFTPAKKGKKKVKVYVRIPVVFKLEKKLPKTRVKAKK